jgi:hypothetical protein
MSPISKQLSWMHPLSFRADAIFYFREGLQHELKIECLTTAFGAEFLDLDSLITHAFVQDQKLQCKHTVQTQNKSHRQLATLQGPTQKKAKVTPNPNGNYRGNNFISGYVHSRQPGPQGRAAPAYARPINPLAAAPYGPHAIGLFKESLFINCWRPTLWLVFIWRPACWR